MSSLSSKKKKEVGTGLFSFLFFQTCKFRNLETLSLGDQKRRHELACPVVSAGLDLSRPAMGLGGINDDNDAFSF